MLHQCHSVLIGSTRGSKSWHCHTNDTLTIESKFVKSLNSDEQRKRRVKSTADTDNGCLTIRMYQSLRQSIYLYVKDFITSVLHILIPRNERMLVERTCQRELMSIERRHTFNV